MNRWLDRWLTLLLLALIGWAGWSCLHWLWRGADWTVVMTNLPLYAVGSYPEAERWRPLLCIAAVVVLIAITLLTVECVEKDVEHASCANVRKG